MLKQPEGEHAPQPTEAKQVIGGGVENDLSTTTTKEGFAFMANFPSQPPPPQAQVQAQPPQPSASPTSRSCASPTLWYYRDPNGDVRGPFDDATMAAWFSAGYFPVTNEVRRKCDKVFLRISEFLSFSVEHTQLQSHSILVSLFAQMYSSYLVNQVVTLCVFFY